MQAYSLDIVRQSDSEVLDAIQRALQQVGHGSLTITLVDVFGIRLGPVVADAPTHGEPLATVLLQASSVIQVFRCELPDLHLTVRRPEGTFDKLTIEPTGTPTNKSELALLAQRLLAALRKLLRPVDSSPLLAATSDQSLQHYYASREAMLGRLENMALGMVEEQAAHRQALGREFDQRRTDLEDEIREARRVDQEAHEQRLHALGEREAELQKVRLELDDRTNRHARRQIRQEFKKKLDERGVLFSLTPGTRRLRWPIHAVSVSLLLALAVAIGTLLQGASVVLATGALVAQIAWFAKQLTLSVAFFATVTFYIRWNNEWFSQHAREEFRLKRLELDIDRASWLVEMLMEWQRESNNAVPEALIQRLSANLFDDSAQVQAGDGKRALLDTLLGSSSEANIKLPGGNEFSVNRKGLKRIQDEISS